MTNQFTLEQNKFLDNYCAYIRQRFATNWVKDFDRNDYNTFEECVLALDICVLTDPLNKIHKHMEDSFIGNYNLHLYNGCGSAAKQWKGWLGSVWRFGYNYQAACHYFEDCVLIRSRFFVYNNEENKWENKN